MKKVMLWLLWLSALTGVAGPRAGGYVSGHIRASGTIVAGYYRGPSSAASTTLAARPFKIPLATPSSGAYSAKTSVARSAPVIYSGGPTRVKTPASKRRIEAVYAGSPTIRRSADGRIARSSSARQRFLNESGYPNGRPGYIVDHVVALKRGGADTPSNMQWQTVEDAKAKDRVE